MAKSNKAIWEHFSDVDVLRTIYACASEDFDDRSGDDFGTDTGLLCSIISETLKDEAESFSQRMFHKSVDISKDAVFLDVVEKLMAEDFDGAANVAKNA